MKLLLCLQLCVRWCWGQKISFTVHQGRWNQQIICDWNKNWDWWLKNGTGWALGEITEPVVIVSCTVSSPDTSDSGVGISLGGLEQQRLGAFFTSPCSGVQTGGTATILNITTKGRKKVCRIKHWESNAPFYNSLARPSLVVPFRHKGLGNIMLQRPRKQIAGSSK